VSAQPDHRPWRWTDGDTRCQKCGSVNPTWWVQHEVWNAVVGGNPHLEAPGILCPNCFIAKADEAGYARGGAWQLYPPGRLY
jgi:hypothetical protein